MRGGAPCVGVIAAPALGETVYAATGQGCWYRRDGSEARRVQTSAVTDPTEAFVVATEFVNTDLDPRASKPALPFSRLYTTARRFR